MEFAEKIMKEIHSAISQNERFVLGIDGLSRAGKTTFVKKLASMLESKEIQNMIIHIDDHIVERKSRYNTGQDEWQEYYYLQWDIESLKEILFEKLSYSNDLKLPYYDHALDRHEYKELNIADKKVIIVEGIFLLRKEWSSFFDFAVFLDCPREIRFSRESLETQLNIEKFNKRYWKAEDFYLEKVRPIEKAHLVLSCEKLVEN
ncbi:kinase [Mesobacillus jeotgali]|uniref:kinase n=1 Tax=Mesobacillus jeotgali TaxID=129985 RepID=UPI002D776F24|nr:kinase [Mesobacillus jeotgali]